MLVAQCEVLELTLDSLLLNGGECWIFAGDYMSLLLCLVFIDRGSLAHLTMILQR